MGCSQSYHEEWCRTGWTAAHQCSGSTEGCDHNAAYQYFEEDRKGTLEAGKLADLVILNEDPLKAEPMKLRDIQVMETIKEGRTIYKKAA